MIKTNGVLLTIGLLSACSNHAIYDNIQLNKQLQCSKLPPSQYEHCMESAKKPYLDYERERQEMLNKAP